MTASAGMNLPRLAIFVVWEVSMRHDDGGREGEGYGRRYDGGLSLGRVEVLAGERCGQQRLPKEARSHTTGDVAVSSAMH